jgi:hypothetical protein
MNDQSFARSRTTAAVISLSRSFMGKAWAASIPKKTFRGQGYCDELAGFAAPG